MVVMPTQQDENHLKLLEIFHYVAAGVTVLVGCIPFVHLAIGIGLQLVPVADHPAAEIPRIVGWVLIVFATIIILVFWALALVILVSGRNLCHRQRYKFCLIVAGISCLLIPYGTVLGVLTIMTLMRPSVKQIFGVDESAVTEADDVPGSDDPNETAVE